MSTQTKVPENLRYVILSGKGSGDPEAARIHDRAYSYWKGFWGEIYAQAGCPEAFVYDDFLRQDFIPVLLDGDEVVAMHLYTMFHLKQLATQDHRYFKFYPPRFFDYMNKRQANSALSIEFLTVDPAWRKSLTGVSLGETLIGASLKYLGCLGLDAAIAPARADNKVNLMCYAFGFECFEKDVVKRNFRVDLVAGFRGEVKPNTDQRINSLIEQYWNNRVDFTGRTLNHPIRRIAQAA